MSSLLKGALKKAPKADIVAGMSGYLGPGNSQDGLIYLGFQSRGDLLPVIIELRLLQEVKANASGLREKRRVLASTILFFLVRSLLTHKLSSSRF